MEKQINLRGHQAEPDCRGESRKWILFRIILGGLLLSLFHYGTAFSQGNVVSGTVLDASHYPMPGVIVEEKGSANHTVTDLQGQFTLRFLSEKPSLVASYAGFKTLDYPLSADDNSDFTSDYAASITLIPSIPETSAQSTCMLYPTNTRRIKFDASGKVISLSSKKPMPGVLVKEKSSGLAVLTDATGLFSIKTASETPTLIITFPGFMPLVERLMRPLILTAGGNFNQENNIEVTLVDNASHAANATLISSFIYTRESFKPTVRVIPEVKKPDENKIPKPSLFTIGKYHALLIGVDQYTHSSVIDLNFPTADCKKLYAILTEKYSFPKENVQFLPNPRRLDVTNALDEYSRILTSEDNLLIFYAGHGHWDERMEQGFWIPADGESTRRGNWISNSEIRDYVNSMKTQHTLLITDACFGGTIFNFTRELKPPSLAIEELYKLASRKAITSGTKTPVPDKSVFLQSMIDKLSANQRDYLAAADLFNQFKETVTNNSPSRQIPQYGVIYLTGDTGGDFIFVKKQ